MLNMVKITVPDTTMVHMKDRMSERGKKVTDSKQKSQLLYREMIS